MSKFCFFDVPKTALFDLQWGLHCSGKSKKYKTILFCPLRHVICNSGLYRLVSQHYYYHIPGFSIYILAEPDYSH